MKKMIKSLVVVATIVIAFGIVGTAFAQSTLPEASDQAIEPGFRGGRGGHGYLGQDAPQGTMDGVLHDAFMAAYADALGISVEELEMQLSEGNSLADIALENNYTLEEFWTLKQEIRASVIEQAVSDGILTEEQADWMETRGAGMRNGMGRRGLGAGYEDCPNN